MVFSHTRRFGGLSDHQRQRMADEIQITRPIPTSNTVVKGDTLWDVSGKFLKHPWQWPELWRTNTQIKNPHLIYPAIRFYFSGRHGKPQLNCQEPTCLSPKRLPIPPACLRKKTLGMAGKTSRFRRKANCCPAFAKPV